QVARACQLRLEPGWIPGQKAGYHPGSSWFILGELVRRVDGRGYDQYVREEIFLPLGEADAWVGIPRSAWDSYGGRIAQTLITSGEPRGQVNRFNDPQMYAIPRPGANARGPVRAMARVYEALLSAPQRLKLTPELASAMFSRQRQGMFDHTFKCVLDWGLGVMIDSKSYAGEHPYGYGRHASDRAFGHSGNQTSCVFADPAHGLVVGWVCTGMCGEAAHDLRQRQINSAVYEDLGLGAVPGVSAAESTVRPAE
ncbi:MAG: beta-lactamase family protein, partial [Phycisphaerae bacterium]|nr:beta-lactamase family protein [Phycisphaerae bacterium]